MTDYTTMFDTAAWKETGRGLKVSCYEDGELLWHRYCLDQKEADETTGDICPGCGCADFKAYINPRGSWRQCLRCWLARPAKGK
jgi:hypothetical protein